MEYLDLAKEFRVRDGVLVLEDDSFSGELIREMDILGGVGRAYSLENVEFIKCGVKNKFCCVGRSTELRNVRFSDLKVNAMEISSSVHLHGVVEGRWPKYLSLKRLYKDRLQDEKEALEKSTELNLVNYSGGLEVWGFPLEKLKLNPELHFIVDSSMLDSASLDDLDISENTSHVVDSVKYLKRDGLDHVVFSIPKDGGAKREYEVLREAGLLKQLGSYYK